MAATPGELGLDPADYEDEVYQARKVCSGISYQCWLSRRGLSRPDPDDPYWDDEHWNQYIAFCERYYDPPRPAPEEIRHFPNAEMDLDDLDTDDEMEFEDVSAYPYIDRDEQAIVHAADEEHLSSLLTQTCEAYLKHDIEYIKPLGKGGMGLAALFRHTPRNHGNQPPKYFVVKLPVQGGEKYLENEDYFYCLLSRSKHIVQLVEAHNLTDDPKSKNMLDVDFTQAEQKALILEYLKYGDLERWLDKFRSTRDWKRKPATRVPDPVLWQIFACLMQACVALQFPPCHQPVKNTYHFVGSPIDEEFPQMEDVMEQPEGKDHLYNYNVVHFDIDPGNIFVADLADDHPFGPLLKLADFGLAADCNMDWFDQDLTPWQARVCGKAATNAPEMWSAEWRALEDGWNPVDDTGLRVAGQYGQKTNIWQVGLTMWSCITLLMAKDKHDFRPVKIDGKRKWSLGWDMDLPKYFSLDADLKKLVKECLMYFPQDRPSLKDLQARVNKGLQRVQNNDRSAPLAQEWVKEVFQEPPPPTTRFPWDETQKFNIQNELRGLTHPRRLI